MPPIITVEHISKKYRIGALKRSNSFRDLFDQKLRSIFKPDRDQRRTQKNSIWAVKDVSFQVEEGEVLGIIGRNGAGKSTLLKILSRITGPTEGLIRMKGRVASLLEVGTGFSGELTGRENIFLNGAILGMRRSEILRQFDEIVHFAEVQKFIDTPIKHYSSGMFMRLAFAVAAHLEPEILIVDEVLAVGDLQFQKKCLNKMEEIGKAGRTILFVSHNIAAVKQLCSRAILLSNGSLELDASPAEAAAYYMQSASKSDEGKAREYRHKESDGRATITRIAVNGEHGIDTVVAIYDTITISIEFELAHDMGELEFFVFLHSSDGDVQTGLFQRDSGTFMAPRGRTGTAEVVFTNYFVPGRYLVSAAVCDKTGTIADWVDQAETMIVEPSFSDGRKFDHRQGRSTIVGTWRLREKEELNSGTGSSRT